MECVWQHGRETYNVLTATENSYWQSLEHKGYSSKFGEN